MSRSPESPLVSSLQSLPVSSSVSSLVSSIDELISTTDFSGVVHLSRHGATLYECASGYADRAHRISNTIDTQFGTASAVKGFTALVVMSLIEDGLLTLETTARSVLGDELPLIAADVTVGHLLAHTSGIGDYLDEDLLGDINDYTMTVPVQQLTTTADYLVMLDGHPTKFAAGERFEYCNGAFIVLAHLAELVSGSSLYDLVAERVLEPAGMPHTAYLRTDQLPGSAAIGYLPAGDGWRTNHFHLPIRGSGDGGGFTTIGDFCRFWPALFNGSILPQDVVDEMVAPRNDASEGRRYGLGFWLRGDRQTVMLEGYDAGVSFRSAYDQDSGLLYTVISNTSEGAWPIVKLIDSALIDLAAE